MSADGASAIQTLRAFVEGYPQGGRIERHAHDLDQLAVITESAAIIETDDVYVVHPCMHALWLPAGVLHSIFSPRPFYLHALYFEPRTLRIRRHRRRRTPGLVTDPTILATYRAA